MIEIEYEELIDPSKGIIKLMNRSGIVKMSRYTCYAHREKIIDKWKRLYAGKFKTCFLQIEHTNTKMIKK